MKKTFDILPLSPTQWVLVDKTRKPRKGENCISLEDDELYMEIFIYDGRFDDMTEEEIDEEGLLNQTFPILAAYPKIDGVLLLPSTLWEKVKCIDCGGDGIETCHNPDHGFLRSVVNALRNANESACPACGHDSEYKIRKNKCETCAGEGYTTMEVAENYANEVAYDDEIEFASPRALEIEVGEDGSIPSENGVIIYKKAIY